MNETDLLITSEITTVMSAHTPSIGEMENNGSLVSNCEEFTVEDDITISFWKFWLEGVTQVIISVFGLFGNILSIYILTRYVGKNSVGNMQTSSKYACIHKVTINTHYEILFFRKEMRNSFNFLLISLLCFDSWYLFGAILDSIRKKECFGEYLLTDVHTILFPYMLYPAMSIFMSASIFMTVAIALERYIAVHYPIGKFIIDSESQELYLFQSFIQTLSSKP